MPFILKQRRGKSPGIITFTSGEALYGLPRKSKKVQQYLATTAKKGTWIYGVHCNGDPSGIKRWPLESWQSFILWSDIKAEFLSDLPKGMAMPYSCTCFMPESITRPKSGEKDIDIIVNSRPFRIKRIKETLFIIRTLMDLKPDLKVVLVVSDPRKIQLGERYYRKLDIEREFFTYPRMAFTANELKNISIICSSQESFGNLPISGELLTDLIARSKFLLLTSHSEGVPRVLSHALLAGTPCIVSKNLRCGIKSHLNNKNTVFIDDDVQVAAGQILFALDNYHMFSIEKDATTNAFSETTNTTKFKEALSELIISRGHTLEGKWFMDELHLRLACHGQKVNYQFLNNEKLFFKWLEKAETLEGYDEEFLFGPGPLDDAPRLNWFDLSQSIRHFPGKISGKIRLEVSRLWTVKG